MIESPTAGNNRSLNSTNDVKGLLMLKLAFKVGSRGGAMVSTSARNSGDPWFESVMVWPIFVRQYSFVYINACIVQHFKSSKNT